MLVRGAGCGAGALMGLMFIGSLILKEALFRTWRRDEYHMGPDTLAVLVTNMFFDASLLYALCLDIARKVVLLCV